MSVQFSVLLYCWVWLCAAEVNPGLGPVTHRIRSFSSSFLTGIAPLLSSSQELLFPVLWQEIWAFLGVLAVFATITQFYMNRMFLEVHKTLREKRKKKITWIPHSTSRAVLRAELGEKKEANKQKQTYKQKTKDSFYSLCFTGHSFSLLLVRNWGFSKSFCCPCPLCNSAKGTSLDQIWDNKEELKMGNSVHMGHSSSFDFSPQSTQYHSQVVKKLLLAFIQKV